MVPFAKHPNIRLATALVVLAVEAVILGNHLGQRFRPALPDAEATSVTNPATRTDLQGPVPPPSDPRISETPEFSVSAAIEHGITQSELAAEGLVVIPWNELGSNLFFNNTLLIKPIVYSAYGLDENEAARAGHIVEELRQFIFEEELSSAKRERGPEGEFLIVPAVEKADGRLQSALDSMVENLADAGFGRFGEFVGGLIQRSSPWNELLNDRRFSVVLNGERGPYLAIQRDPFESPSSSGGSPLDGSPGQNPLVRGWLTARYGHLIVTDVQRPEKRR